ncbi:MAG: hypothetical protein HZR80_02705 [Candidatus Heimdallarchaeota archaeon]
MSDKESTKNNNGEQLLRCISNLITYSYNKRESLNGDLLDKVVILIRTLTDEGFIRTHSFLTSWIKEYIRSGLLEEKEQHQLIASLPWSEDQSRFYLYVLEGKKLISSERNSNKKKIYLLNLTNNLPETSELSNLLYYYSKISRKSKFNLKNINKLLLVYHRCLTKERELANIGKQFEQRENEIRPITGKESSTFIESLIESYLVVEEGESINAKNRLVKILSKQPLLYKGLCEKKGEIIWL